jgi:D-amino-acid dehydrogenase
MPPREEPAEPVDVAIVGAGAIGACVALECVRAGASVAVLDAGDGWGTGCSLGNAGLICPSHAGPFATAGDLTNALRWALRGDSPFGVRPSPALVPWLARLLRFTVDRRHARTVTSVLRQLAHESLALHAAYGASGIPTGFERRGLLDVYRTAAAFRTARQSLPAGTGGEGGPIVLDEVEARTTEPLLEGRIAGGILHPGEGHCDPARFVRAVGRAAEAAGARLLTGRRVSAVRQGGSGAELVVGAEAVRASTVVVAAGVQTRALIPQTPIVSGTGYSVDLTSEGAPMPGRPLVLNEARVAITPLSGTLRLGGAMVIGRDPHPQVDHRRLHAVHRAGIAALPAWSDASGSPGWAGARPCTSDGLPTIGPVDRHRGVIVAAGHAMLGVTLAPITGQLVRGIIDGRPDPRAGILSPKRPR